MDYTTYLNEVTTAFDTLVSKVKEELDEQYNKGRLKGSDYANVYSSLVGSAMQLSVNMPLQNEKINTEQKQQSNIEANTNLTEENRNLVIKKEITEEKQQALIDRQTKGFDDHLKQKMLDIQLNSWSLMFSSGLLDDKPAIITNDEVSTLYNNLKTELGI